MLKEPRPTMILRLLAEASVGKQSEVSLADAFEFRRNQYGLTRSEFAALLGCTLQRYGEVLNGKRNLTMKMARRAFAIGVPAIALLGEYDAAMQGKEGA